MSGETPRWPCERMDVARLVDILAGAVVPGDTDDLNWPDATVLALLGHIGWQEDEVARLRAEVERLTNNERVAVSYAGECKADLVRSEKKVERLTRERDAAGEALGQCEDETLQDAAKRVTAEVVSRVDAWVDAQRAKDAATERAETAERERDEAIAAAAPGLASLEELTAEIERQVESGEFAAGLSIAKDVVGRCVLAWAKHSMGERVKGCRVLVTAPVVILLRNDPESSPATGATDDEPGYCEQCDESPCECPFAVRATPGGKQS